MFVWFGELVKLDVVLFELASSSTYREFVFVGVVVGLVAVFGVFIGGVLFFFEEVSMFWS